MKRILVVEDHELNQELALEVLTSAGMEVTLANHGREAVERVKQREFDGILMDIQMPVMDGYEATREIRKLAGRADLPIIAVTANAINLGNTLFFCVSSCCVPTGAATRPLH